MNTDNRQIISSGEYWLFIDPNGGTDFSNVVCLTDHSLSLSNAAQNKTTYCGPFSTAGDQTKTVDFNGVIILDPADGEISAPDLFTLAQNKTVFSWKYAKGENPTSVDFIKSGFGFFSAYSEKFSASDMGLCSGTISISGLIAQEFETVSE